MKHIASDILSKISSSDALTILAFILLNLLIGIYFSRGVTSLKEYALGSRNFSTATIVSTIVATWLGGTSFAITSYESYKNGLYFIIPGIADGLSFFIVAYFYIPRMQEFLGKLSIAEVMGDMYGRHVRTCTALSAIIPTIGNVAMQFYVLTTLLTDLMGISGMYAVMLSSFVIIMYSTFGGIKAVTFTDIVQFLTFSIVIPMTAFFIWLSFDDPTTAVLRTFETNPSFSLRNVMDYNNPRFFETLLLFLFFIIPALDPALFQRISMSQNVKQASKAFFIAPLFIILCEYVIIYFIGVLLLSDTTNTPLNDDNVTSYVLNTYLKPGFKGVFVVGIIAMCMSTADSYINTSAIITQDLCKSIGINILKKWELFAVRLTAFCIGVFALAISIFSQNIFNFIINTYSFYMAVVSGPFILSIFGFRSSGVAVLLGMSGGFFSVVTLKLYTDVDNSAFIGMLFNLAIYISAHYLLKQPGGWIKSKDNEVFLGIQAERKARLRDLRSKIINFSIINYLKDTTAKEEYTYIYLGLFCIISAFFSLYSLPKIIINQHKPLMNSLLYIPLLLSSILITYPAWLEKFKSSVFISFILHLTIFMVLILINSFQVFISNFGQLQIIIFIVSLNIAAILLRWQVALFFVSIGMLSAIPFYQYYTEMNFSFENINTEFSIILYTILMICTIAIAFIRPKQEALSKSEAISSNLLEKIRDMDHELRKAYNLKSEFLSNINHEVRTPITGITSLGQALWDNYDNIPEEKRRECVSTIAKNSERLLSLMNNILDLSSLTSLKMDLYLKRVNLSHIVQDSIARCKKLYLGKKELLFNLNIEENIYAKCDDHYITHTIDNLIINAICYSKPRSTIQITLCYSDKLVRFSIRDEGTGILPEELLDIFKPFSVGSNTRSTAGGRGVGLALCSAVISAHKGKIWAESDGISWTEFKFELLIK